MRAVLRLSAALALTLFSACATPAPVYHAAPGIYRPAQPITYPLPR